MNKFKPRKYQEPMIDLLKTHDNFGVLSFPGSGKTVMTLDMLYLYREPTLIIVPLEIMYTTWMSEPKKWEFSQNLKCTVLHGKNKDVDFFKPSGITFINPEGMKWLVNKVKQTKRFPWKILVIDESVKFKNPSSVRFKALKQMLRSFKKRYILSGNPMPNTYLDLWSQIFILDLGERLGSSWYSFRNKYFYPTDYKRFNWEIKPGAKEEIIELLNDVVYFLDTSDEIDLPEVVETDIPILLPPKAKKIYKQMEKDLFAQLDGGENILAPNKTSAHMKCWQIANGFMYSTDEDEVRTTHHVHDELINATKTLVDSLQGHPILIAYHFQEDLTRLKKAFPHAHVAQSGISKHELQKIERDWNANKIPVLIAYVSKLSHGLNLQHGDGHNILFYCLTYNHDIYTQLIYRLKRQGAKFNRVMVHRLVAKDTIHEAIITSLGRKETQSKGFLLALKEYRNQLK